MVLWLVCITGLQAQISVVPTVKHLTSTSTPSAGAITLVVSGGTSPYSYTWTPGSIFTKDITNKVKNTYVVKVKDSAPTTVTYTYNIGYKADWDQMYGCISRNDSLKSDATRLWSQAVTKNNLAASTAGWVEYILKGTTETKVFGVLDSLSPLPNSYADIDYGYYYEGPTNSLYEIYNGILTNVSVGLTEGTALRVERSGSTIKFVVNGITTRTVSNASAAAKVWKMKALIYGDIAGSSFVNMGCSFATKGGVTFKNYSNIIPYMAHSAGLSLNDGSIRVKPLKTGSYTYTWQPGSVTSATITSKSAGTYSLSAKDATNTITPKNYNLGYKVKWDQMYRCSVRQDSLIGVDLGQDGWESAISKNTLPGGTNGWFEYVLHDMSQYKMIGFTDSLSPYPNNIYDLDYGFYYELGTLYTFGVTGYFQPVVYNTNEGTVLRVERRG
ncbi:MAG: SprB repeat-containing protein, partial [Bacteroidia bacterium]|nr:SprB repeat-containing protein [Bacteroidia bacterium]